MKRGALLRFVHYGWVERWITKRSRYQFTSRLNADQHWALGSSSKIENTKKFDETKNLYRYISNRRLFGY